MATIKQLLQCFTSPRLYRIHGTETNEAGWNYEPKYLERWGDMVIKSLWVFLNIKYISVPVIGIMLYRKCYVALTGLGLLLACSYGLRAAGRSTNEAYVAFLRSLNAAHNDFNRETKRSMMRYDFEFDAWPVEFKWNDTSGDGTKRPSEASSAVNKSLSIGERLMNFPCKAIGYTVANTFGYKLLFPGSIQTLQFFIDGAIQQGRNKLVEEDRAERFKLETSKGNFLDSAFVDRRKKGGNGETLVICCEGNAGFYEIGVMNTPLQTGYSVLGWNYPGFGWSTGTPYPSHVTDGMDAVMQFAIRKLDFKPENIVIFAWSIGGFALSWAGMSYPDLKGVILDASFDDVLPLALSRFPSSWEPLVRCTVRDYMNLNNGDLLTSYGGPVLLYRRTEDEIIAIDPELISTNCGNDLLVHLLKHRYPLLVHGKPLVQLKNWLGATPAEQALMWSLVDEDRCASTLISYMSEHSNSFPAYVGEKFSETLKVQLVIFLARKHLEDYNSTHCTPLPSSIFHLPWDISPESDFVKL